MEPTADDIAGVADLFGGLTRAELRRAFEDLAARRGTDLDPDDLDEGIDGAIAEFYLLAIDRGEDDLLAPGPLALPALPDHAEDLPHMLDVEERSVDDDALASAAAVRLRGAVDRAVREGDDERIEELLDVCYEVDAWGVDTGEARERLLAALG